MVVLFWFLFHALYHRNNLFLCLIHDASADQDSLAYTKHTGKEAKWTGWTILTQSHRYLGISADTISFRLKKINKNTFLGSLNLL